MFFLPFLRTLPAKHVDKIAEQMRKHNINALLIVGGFEVCLHLFVTAAVASFANEATFSCLISISFLALDFSNSWQ